MWLAALPARAQALPDSTATADTSSTKVTTPAPESPASRLTRGTADSTRRRAWHEEPRFVMARSLLVPGWGQAHNGAWYKAAAVATGEVWLATRIMKDQRELDRLSAEIDQAVADSAYAHEVELVNQYNNLLQQRVARQWLFGALLAYALIDAYVDAHFRGFELEFQTDPALPAGREPAPGGRGRVGARVALRWNF